MEDVEQTFTGTADFGKTATATISRNGDLIHSVWLEVDLPALDHTAAAANVGWARNIGTVLLEYVDLEIGGTRIDRHYGDWLQIYNQLAQREERKVAYDNLTGNTTALYGGAAQTVAAARVRVPMQFWFNRNIGLALPLIA